MKARFGERVEDSLESITDRINECVRRGKFSLEDLQSSVTDKSQRAAQETNDFVHENSWKVVGIVAVLGVIVGMLISRR